MPPQHSTMPVFTLDDFRADITYSGDPIPWSPELEAFDVYCDAAIPLDRQIFFRFHHGSACTNIFLNPSLFSCIACVVTDYLHGIIPTEGGYVGRMINLAESAAMHAVEEAQPSDRVVYVDVYQRQDQRRIEEAECDAMVPEDDWEVQALASKIVSSADCSETCAICLEDVGIGQEALTMPCCHVFHGGCIKVWLKKSHSCPLCRFELPSAAWWGRARILR